MDILVIVYFHLKHCVTHIVLKLTEEDAVRAVHEWIFLEYDEEVLSESP